MRWRHMLAATCGLAAAVAWATLLVAQEPRYLPAAQIATSSNEPILLRLFVLPSLLQGVAGMLLVIPMTLAGVAVMLRVNRAAAGLRGMALTGFTTAAIVVVAIGGLVLVSSARLGRGTQLELAGAAALLLLHGVTALLLSRPRDGAQADAAA